MNAEKRTRSYHDESSEYTWEGVVGRYAGHVEMVDTEAVPEITIETIDNYRGTHRQMAIIKVKYDETPFVKIGEYENDLMYAIGSLIRVRCVGEYADMYSNKLDNHMTAQFLDENGNALELEGVAVWPDDGSIYPDVDDENGENAFNDIDEDDDTEEETVVGMNTTSTFRVVYSTTQLLKWIKADEYDTYFKEHTQLYAGHDYTYKIQFFCNKGVAKNIVLYDSIEEAYVDDAYTGLPHWKGKLKGVDIAEARSLFGDIKVYVNTSKYYTREEFATDYDAGYAGLVPGDLTEANGWKQVDPDSYSGWANVKTIAFAIGEDVEFGEGDDKPTTVSVYLKMTAPDTIHPDQKPTAESEGEKAQVLAYNEPAYYAEKQNSTTQWSADTTISNIVTVGVKSAELDMPAITKKMTGDSVPEGFADTAEFEIIPEEGTPAPRSYSNGRWGNEISSVKVDLSGRRTTAIADDYGKALCTEPTTVTNPDGTAVGPQRGNYAYTIKEKQGTNAGVTYSRAQYRVEYNVSDVRDDVQYADPTTLTVTQHIYMTRDDEGNELDEPVEVESVVFSNAYKAVPVSFTLPTVEKKITGDERPEEKTFTFKLLPYAPTMPMPENDTITITGEGTAEFGEITFDKAGSYVYRILEIGGSDSGYTYDSTLKYVVVYVNDENGQLVVTRVDMFSQASADEQSVSVTDDTLVFTNDYRTTPSDAVVIPDVNKAFTGAQRPSDETFTFGIRAKAGQGDIPMPAQTEVTVTGSGRASFEGGIVYDRAGTYVYEIYEKPFSGAAYTGYTRDETVYTYTVTVTDNNSQLEASGVLTKNGQAADAVIFTNDYTPEAAVSAAPTVVKVIDGDVPADNAKTFTFTIRPLAGQDEDIPMPANTTASVTGAGNATAFGDITFTAPGTYIYEIFEQPLDDSCTGYTRDTAVYLYVVRVTDVHGVLTASAALTKEGVPAEQAVFTNKYRADSTEIAVPAAVKVVDGTVPEGADREFSFGIRAAEGMENIPMPANTTAVVTGTGAATQFGSIVFDAVGTYVYEIFERELDSTYTGYTRDETVYTFTVAVTDNDGRLEAVGTLTRNGEAAEICKRL